MSKPTHPLSEHSAERGATHSILPNSESVEAFQLEVDVRQEEKLKSLGLLAAGIAHDFNNLLTAISGYSNLCLQFLTANHPVRNYCQEIERATQRGSSLTRQLLAFSGKRELNRDVLDLNQIVTDMGRMLKRLIGEHINLITELRTSNALINADRGQVEQVLVNLVVNARDAMPQGGTLTIRTDTALLNATEAKRIIGKEPGTYVLLTVTDTGIGMDTELQSRIFEPFFTTKKEEEGTGLGLSVVSGIVNQSEGAIRVISEPAKGSSFEIYFLLAAVSEKSSGPQSYDAIDPRGTETILIAEDDDLVREMLRESLTHLGYNILEATDGNTALRICNSHKNSIRVVITDVTMPNMDGFHLAEKLLNQFPEIRLLFMSGYAEEDISGNDVMDEGVFIQKPFDAITLGRRIRSVLDHEAETTRAPTVGVSSSRLPELPPLIYGNTPAAGSPASGYEKQMPDKDNRIRILIVDDEVEIGEILVDLLCEDYEVTTATSGEAALEIAKDFVPDIVLCDIAMPGISGLEMLPLLHEIVPNAVAIMISGMQTIEAAIGAMRAGAYDYIMKPFDLRPLEAAVRRAVTYQEFRDRARWQEDFISIVSHELRAPLQAPLRYLENILSGNYGPLSKKQRVVIQRAAKGINTEVQIVNNLLDLQYLDSGRFYLKGSQVSLRELIQEVIDSFLIKANDCGVRLLWQPTASAFETTLDSEQIKQAVCNLLTNALDHTPRGKTVTVKLFRSANSACCIFRDEGVGIPQSYRQKIFDRSFQVPTKGKKGLGIGLYIAREIIRAHGGQIKVRSRLETGSIFMITLPL